MTELWDKRIKVCTKVQKNFASSVSDGTCKQKQMWKRNRIVHHTNQNGGIGRSPLYKEKEMIIKKDKFKNIFKGLTIAYGQYQPGERGDNGKQKGKAFIVRGQVTDELWENHLEGKGPALGIIPITENNDCRWGCIDIDEYNFDHTSLIKSIRNQ